MRTAADIIFSALIAAAIITALRLIRKAARGLLEKIVKKTDAAEIPERRIIKMLRITCKIDGMMCGMCESHINDAIRKNFDIKKVSSSHTKGETIITTEKDIDDAKLKSVIDETGYELKSVERSEAEQKGGFLGLFGKKK